MFSLKRKNVLVMGLGLLGGGVSVAKWLVRQGAAVTITDVKSKQELKKSIAELENLAINWHLGGHKKNDFIYTDIIIQNPAVPNDSPFLRLAKKHHIPIYNEAGLFFLLARRPIIGITGTRGKSTTSFILYKILREKYKNVILAGNIGTSSMFGVIEESMRPSNIPIVLELSSWQVEGLPAVKKSPHVSLLTNLYPDHLNRYPSKTLYYKAKQAIFKFQSTRDVSIFNYDNLAARRAAGRALGKVYWFSIKDILNHRCGTSLMLIIRLDLREFLKYIVLLSMYAP